nr:hypothetical protein [Streptomyces sp. MBT62]
MNASTGRPGIWRRVRAAAASADRVADGEREGDAGYARECRTGACQAAVPASVGRQQRCGQQQDEQEQEVVGAGEDVVGAESEHGHEASPRAALAEVDRQWRDLHMADVEADGAHLGGAVTGDPAGRPVLTYRHQRDVGDHLVHDHVVVEGEVAYVGAGGRGEYRFGEQFAVRAGRGLFGAAEAQGADGDLPCLALEGGRVDVGGEVGADRRGPGGEGRRLDGGEVDAAGRREVAHRQGQLGGDGVLVHVELDHRVRHRVRGGRRRSEEERRRYRDRDPGHQAKQRCGQPSSRSGHEKVNSLP